jgi:hypothetical protein
MWSKFSGDRLRRHKYPDSILFSMRLPTALATAFALALAGCSTALYDIGPGTQYRREEDARTCGTNRAAPVIDSGVAGLAGFVAALSVIGVAADRHDEDAGLLLIPGFFGAIVFAIYAPTARHGWRAVHHCEAERAKPLRPPPPPSLARDLAESARNAAQRGDCATARVFIARVQTIDADYHDDVVAGDAALAACVDSAPRP